MLNDSEKLNKHHPIALLLRMQMVAHGKSYVDFVDFSLIYLELQTRQHRHAAGSTDAGATARVPTFH
jgi:hypothetical protein